MNNQKWTAVDVGDIQDGIQDYKTALWVHECTKACKGIQDPAAAIPAIVEALKGARLQLLGVLEDGVTMGIGHKVAQIEQALKQVGAL